MSKDRTLVLFTGLAADSRLFDPQRSLPCDLITPEWIEPEEGERLPAFARRVADRIHWPDRFIVGGTSFGGMLAAEMLPIVKPDAAVLIATTLSSRAIPSMLRFARVVAKAIPDKAIRAAGGYSRQFLNIFRDFSDEEHQVFSDMLARTPIARLRRATSMVFHWNGVPAPTCPYVWIHGGKDLVIPVKKVEPTHVIPGAGHMVNWTHAGEVNGIIRDFVDGLDQRAESITND